MVMLWPADAEKLAAAEAAMFAAAEAARPPGCRLPCPPVALLNSEAVAAFLTHLKAAVSKSVDDLPRPLGTPGAEGTKQILQRIITSIEGGLSAGEARVQTLQPAVAAEAPAEPED